MPSLVWDALSFCRHQSNTATSSSMVKGQQGQQTSISKLMALDWLRCRAWDPFGTVVAAAVCVAGVAVGDLDLHFAWQVWHLVTSTVTLRGRCGTYGTGLAPVPRLGPVWHRGRRGCLRGRRGSWRPRPSLCVAGVALGDIDRHFAWQAWHLWHWTGSGGALGTYTHTYIHTSIHPSMHACMHAYIHTYIHTYMPSFYTPSFFVTHHLSHTTLYCTTQLFLIFDPSPPPSSFLPSPSRYNICCPLLEEVDIWGYLVRFFPTRS